MRWIERIPESAWTEDGIDFECAAPGCGKLSVEIELDPISINWVWHIYAEWTGDGERESFGVHGYAASLKAARQRCLAAIDHLERIHKEDE